MTKSEIYKQFNKCVNVYGYGKSPYWKGYLKANDLNDTESSKTFVKSIKKFINNKEDSIWLMSSIVYFDDKKSLPQIQQEKLDKMEKLNWIQIVNSKAFEKMYGKPNTKGANFFDRIDCLRMSYRANLIRNKDMGLFMYLIEVSILDFFKFNQGAYFFYIPEKGLYFYPHDDLGLGVIGTAKTNVNSDSYFSIFDSIQNITVIKNPTKIN